MDYLECAVVGNNLAVDQMLAGEHRAALATYKIALEALCDGVAYCTPTVTASAPHRSLGMLQNASASTMSPFLPVALDSDIPLSSSDASRSTLFPTTIVIGYSCFHFYKSFRF